MTIAAWIFLPLVAVLWFYMLYVLVVEPIYIWLRHRRIEHRIAHDPYEIERRIERIRRAEQLHAISFDRPRLGLDHARHRR